MAKNYKTAARAYKSVARSMNTRVTPQSQIVPGKNQVMNNAGGAVFTLSQWDYLMRFLILGSEGGTYYVGEHKLTRENAHNVESCIREDGKRVVDMCIEVSDSGRAPKNDPAIFALAMVAGLGNEESRKYALDNLHKVCRIGTHLFHFADYVQEFRGWGHGLRRAIGRWYTERPTNKLAMQLVKYQSRDGWSHRDLLRLAHPHVTDADKNFALRWAVKGVADPMVGLSVVQPMKNISIDNPLAVIYAYEAVKTATDEKEIVRLVTEYGLPLEAVPTEKQTRKVLAAALENLGITAIIRNLGRYSKEGILTSISAETNYVVEKLVDSDVLRKGRVHPIAILTALMTYKSGKGMRGSSTWDVVSKLVDALDEAFYISFGVVEPTGKRILLALDVSGSMTSSFIGNLNMSARAASSAMAMVTARTEKNWDIVGFTSGRTGYGYTREERPITPLDITPRRRLDDIMKYTEGLDFGGTDCALPMLYAKANRRAYDAFIIYTDSETWAGNIHPFQALKQYRDFSGIDARLIVVGMTATKFTIADPSDKGMLDVVGFDTAAPNVMSEFISGRL